MVLLTSQGEPNTDYPALPEGTVVIHKNDRFHEDLGRYLIDMGLFGKIGETS